MRANMRAFYGLLGRRAPGARVVERHGLTAAIVPSCPDQSVVNGVVYDDPEALMHVREELEATYRGAGVRAWRVWVPERDREVRDWLSERGHELGPAPRAMSLELGGADLTQLDGHDCRRSDDDAMLGELNEQAYGLPDGTFAPALAGLSGDPVTLYLAYEDGEPAACAAAVDTGGDCGIYCVATRPASRRLGLASAAIRLALAEARERGCTTSSLQSSESGFPVYARLGYLDLGAFEVWQHSR
jgi:GNAT superfamily N-acetyltransferase